MALAALPGVELLAVSSTYESDPVGPISDQPAFLNAVAEISTTLPPAALLAAFHEIENALGRTRGVRFGPRTCDLDLLLYGDLESDDPALLLRHPRLAERRFVLDPLAELAPMLVLPDGRPVRAGASLGSLVVSGSGAGSRTGESSGLANKTRSSFRDRIAGPKQPVATNARLRSIPRTRRPGSTRCRAFPSR